MENTNNAPKKSGNLVRNVIIGILVAAFVGVGAFGLLSKTGILMDKLTALEVGDMKVSATEYRIFYNQAEMDLINQYGSTLVMYYGVDLGQPLEVQPYGDGTWGDYLHSSAKQNVQAVYSLYQEAVKNGYPIADENDVTYRGEMALHRTTADSYDMDLDKYIDNVFGKAVSYEALEKVAVIKATATNYYNDYLAGVEVSDSDIDNYYEENKLVFDKVDYRYFSIPYETVKYEAPAEGEELEEGAPTSEEVAKFMTEENRAAAQAKADEFISRITNEASFNKLAKEYADEDNKERYDDPDATLITEGDLSGAETSDTTAWCAEDGRKSGDTTTIDNGYTITVLYFIDRYLPEKDTATVRHILISAAEAAEDATDEEKAEAEEAIAAAKTEIEEIYAEWQAGEKTEESFASLAIDRSSDGGSVTTGGMYDDFAQGTMVEEFDAWCFDPSREYGDTEIVKTEYGYHLIYYVGEGEPSWKVQAREALQYAGYEEYYNEFTGTYALTEHEYGLGLAY